MNTSSALHDATSEMLLQKKQNHEDCIATQSAAHTSLACCNEPGDFAAYIKQLSAKGTNFLGTRYSIIAGAMTWVSCPILVAAISQGGALGVLASGSMNAQQLQDAIEETKKRTTEPFGVNLIMMHPDIEHFIDLVAAQRVPFVFFAAGAPKEHMIKKLHMVGTKVIAFASSLVLAKRLIKGGIDALVIEGNEAGGHVGPVSTLVLAQEILPYVTEIPVFVAGGIGHGSAVLALMEMGAAGCQLGTIFVTAHESQVAKDFKKAFVRAKSRDTVVLASLHPDFTVIPVRAIDNGATQFFQQAQRECLSAIEAGTLTPKEAFLRLEHFWSGKLRAAAVDGDIATGSLMAGQSVGFVIDEQPVSFILERIEQEILQSLALRYQRLSKETA